MLRFRLESDRSELGSVTLHMGIAITDIRDTAITRAAITAIMEVARITERIITAAGLTTVAIGITSITSVIIITTNGIGLM